MYRDILKNENMNKYRTKLKDQFLVKFSKNPLEYL